MDNEEIRKLLQELKESSDESSAVRSKVVKIHMDTPAEAERRRRVREKEKAREEKRLAEERAKAEAEEEARRLEAEHAALEAVEEAKRQAKAGFASDLDEDILSGNLTGQNTDEAGEDIDDLELSWNYEKPELKSGFAREEDFDLGAGTRESGDTADGSDSSDGDSEDASKKGSASRTGRTSGRGRDLGVQTGSDTDPDDGFDSDKADFISGDDEDTERDSVTGLPGLFGALTDRVVSFAGGIRRSVKDDLSKKLGSKEDDEAAGEDEDFDSAGDQDEVITGKEDQEASSEKDELRKASGSLREGLEEIAHFDDSDEPDYDKPRESGQEKKPQREYGPDEEWKRRMEEAPNKRSRFSRLRRERSELRESQRPKKEDRPRHKWSLPKKKGSDQAGTPASEAGENGNTDAGEPGSGTGEESRDDILNKTAEPVYDDTKAISAADDEGSADAPASERTVPSPGAGETGAEDIPIAAAASAERPSAEDSSAAPVARSIEVIDLNESQNNKEAEVIPLVGDTGALPDPSQLKKAAREKSDVKQRSFSLKNIRGGKKTHSFSEFFARNRKLLIIAAVAIAAAAAVAIGVVFMVRQAGNTRHAVIEADDGLTIRVLEQPEEFTDHGDIKIRAKAPETIQSITVNSENVVIEQGRSVDFTYHASTGTLDIMAVSTDKVRSAKVILAYVDSQPPAVTIREEGGKIALSAEDTESGLDAIYVGAYDGLTQIPQYQKYSEPLDADPDKEITYYACDQAGNKTAPVTVALTPAESIAFSRDYYGMYPGSTQQVSLVTTPANAFVNNLVLEAEDPKIVQIEGGTTLRGMAEGDTKITATADGIPGVMASVSVSSQRKVKISAVGDCTLGTDENFSQNTSFNAFEALYGDSYFFEKVKGILSSDDSTFANFEGTLTTSDAREAKQFAFKGDPSYTQILLDGSIDTVNLANNHSKDYGIQSQTDTEHALEEAGIEWCLGDHIAYRDLNGVRTAYIGIYALENGLETLPQVKSTIAEAKENGADLIIVEFHWGAELVEQIDEYQKELAHTAVDEGANLVLGSHAHVLQAIEKYNGAYIVYGLGNFCFGGSSNPTSYDTMIWQQTFTFTADGLEADDNIAIIPCQVSGDLSSNNYQPVPVSGDAAAAIMQKIDSLSAEFGQSYSAYMVDGTLWSE